MAYLSLKAATEEYESIDECFVKAIEYVNKAHQMLRSLAPVAAQQLGKISVEISMVHRQASELVETSEIPMLILARPLLTPAPQGSPQAETWAKVAAKGKARGAAPEEAQINASKAGACLESHTTPAINESPASDQRAVTIRGCAIGTGISDITKHISEGPLLSISLGCDPVRPSVVAGVVFL